MWNNTPINHNPQIPYPNLNLLNYHQLYPPLTSPHHWKYQTQYVSSPVASYFAIRSPQMSYSSSIRSPLKISSNSSKLPSYASSIEVQAQSPFYQPPRPFVPCAAKSEPCDKKNLKQLVDLLRQAPPPPPPPPASVLVCGDQNTKTNTNTIDNNKVAESQGAWLRASENRTDESQTPALKRFCKNDDDNFQLNHKIKEDKSNVYNCPRVGRIRGRGGRRRLLRTYPTQHHNLVTQQVSDKPDPMLTVSSLAPGTGQVSCPTVSPPSVENHTLFSRRPPDTGVRRVWRPAKTVDYGGVWAPGVVANYGEDKKEDFHPSRFDYKHGGEEGINYSHVIGEETAEKVLSEIKDEKNSKDETKIEKVYSRKRLVGFL